MFKKMLGAINSKIRNKLIAVFVAVVAVVFLFISLVSHSFISKVSYENYISSSETMLDMLSIRIDEYIENIKNTSFLLQTDMFFYPEYYSNSSEYKIYNYKIKKLQNLFLQNDEIDSIILYLPDSQESYVVNSKLSLSFKNTKQIESLECYKKVINSDEYLYFQPTHKLENFDERFMLNCDKSVFSITRALVLNNKVYGVLIVNYENSLLNNMLKSAVMLPETEIFLYDKNFKCYTNIENQVYELNKNELQTNIAQNSKGKGNYLYTDLSTGNKMISMYRVLSDENVLVQLIPQNIINSQADYLIKITFAIFIVAMFVLIACAVLLSSSVTKPLQKLKKSLTEVGKGNVDISLNVNSKDEIGEIVTVFNEMTHKINVLINEQYKLNLENKDAQLKQLIAQINPHFLYNTLSSIGSVAHEKGADEVELQLIKLSDILRYTIKDADKLVTLKDEINNTVKYLDIQKFRFEEKLCFTINFDEEFSNIKVPKLLIQPIIENAISHGVEKIKQVWQIGLNVYKYDEMYCQIEVSDNGVGMPKEKIDNYNKIFQLKKVCQVENTQSIGILNIYNRLVLYFDNNFDMTITSNMDKGVTVKIKIPS